MAKAKGVFQPLLLIFLVFSILSLFPWPAQADDLKWSRVSTPSNGESGKWVLASGSDIRCLTRASDGTLYCYANPATTTYRLFKSTDNGATWEYTGKVTDSIVAIAVVPGKTDSVYYATASTIFRSTDAGKSFKPISRNPGGAGVDNIEITSIDAGLSEGIEFVVVGTRDADASQYGGVYILDQSQSFDLIDASIGNYDVFSIALSPDFDTSRQIVAVATDEADTIVTTRLYNSGWDSYVGDARIVGLIPRSAAIAFPDDYTSTLSERKYTQFIALDTGENSGDVYCLKGKAAPGSSKITDLNAGSSWGLANLDISGLAVSGNADKANLIAGTASLSQVYLSEDAGINWMSCNKPPTGASAVYITLAPDFATSGTVYAATSGTESAFSISRDKGNNWSQISLIDTTITNIKDLAISPDYTQDRTLFLLTGGTQDSLWCSSDGGRWWERIFSSALPQVNRINFAAVSPYYNQDKTIFLAGVSNSNQVSWKSEDNGQSFREMQSIDPETGVQVNIDAWRITADGTYVIGSYDGSHALVYLTFGDFSYYGNKAMAGNLPLNSLALSPDYGNDKTILAGNTNGEVFYSEDNFIFKPLPLDATAVPLSGNITVAFDPDYSHNRIIYAASDTANGGIYRFVIGKSTSWESIDSSLPDGAGVNQIVTSSDGVLYGVYSRNVAGESNKGGIERSINPTYNPGPGFDTVTQGVDDGVALRKLWVQGNNLWTVDSINGKLLTYTDNVASSIIPHSPEDNTAGLNTHNVIISWGALGEATSYHWQVDIDKDFTSIPAGFEGDSSSTSARLPALESDTTYFWRVRATAPVTSPWSKTRSFSTVLNTQTVAPDIFEPESNVTASLQPNFRWSAFSGVEYYELQVAADEGFVDLVVDKTGDHACKYNVWKCDVPLKYDTTYYWRVRAVSGSSNNDWAIGIFTTGASPSTSEKPSNPLASTETFVSTPATSLSLPVTATPDSTPGSVISESLMRLVVIFGVSMVVLIIVLVLVVVYMLKKFRRY